MGYPEGAATRLKGRDMGQPILSKEVHAFFADTRHSSLGLFTTALIFIGAVLMTAAPCILGAEALVWLRWAEWPSWSLASGLSWLDVTAPTLSWAGAQMIWQFILDLPLPLATLVLGFGSFYLGIHIWDVEDTKRRREASSSDNHDRPNTDPI